jgi:hypothetical protein
MWEKRRKPHDKRREDTMKTEEEPQINAEDRRSEKRSINDPTR